MTELKTTQVLELIGLKEDEIDTYFNLTGRGPVMVGEIALMSNVKAERAKDIANTLLQKGLVREIPGATPYYEALPPYVALMNQIKQFKESILTLQNATPQKVQYKFKSLEHQSDKLQKFDEYRNYIQTMKTELPAQLKGHFDSFSAEIEQVKQIREVKKYILSLKDIVPSDILQEFDKMESRMTKIKTEISEKFETQFRVPAMRKMAENTVDSVITREFQDMMKYFRTRIVNTTQEMLDRVVNQLSNISDAALDVGSDLDASFVNIESGLKGTLTDLDKRVSQVYEDVMQGIADLKNLFQKEIFETIQNDLILNIINQLEMSEATMREFLERAKRTSLLSFKDVWFVRSQHGMMAQVNDCVSRVKMRLHIICPTIENIDLLSLSQVRKHVNVRICTSFDTNNQNHMQMINMMKEYDNFNLRFYPRENIWSINRDFEEVVVCVLSKSEFGTQIAGMGSVLEEHVKLFAALLEDVWIQSKRLDAIGIR
ncbi:MAG: helix-turn-helix domain-containing protein [Promethearchaeota archaeon]